MKPMHLTYKHLRYLLRLTLIPPRINKASDDKGLAEAPLPSDALLQREFDVSNSFIDIGMEFPCMVLLKPT